MGLMPLRHSYGGHKKIVSMSVPLPMVLSLCLACLLVGYIVHHPGYQLQVDSSSSPRRLQHSTGQVQQQTMQQTVQPPELVKAPAESAASLTDTAHAPQQQDTQQQQGLAALAPAVSQSLPDMQQFSQEFLQQSGLLQLRPPLTPAKSGYDHYTVIPYQILSWYPRILVFPAFIDNSTAAHIIALAKRRMAPSGLAWRKDEKPDANQQVRTSSGVFVSSEEDTSGLMYKLEDKIAQVTLLPPSHGEAFNVLRYEFNQKYDSHMDTFDPKDFGPQYSQRMATMLLYLSDVQEGGETIFKREGRNGDRKPVTDWASCEEDAFKYKPRMGDAVLFYSLDPDLKINPRSLHGGCPVKKGEKWVATRWIHEKPLKTSNLEEH